VPQTPISTVEEARKIAIDVGLRYVYAGNIPGHPWENTYCPKCHELLIERHGFNIRKWVILPDKTCPKCRTKIPITGNHY
ncbi:MAG: AmmeMemoRadiSam system radical SAM enzyme, partial [Candidatus Bathyarchaeota archaeon]|nr:AmmeMemoRadiSam system radical SAM enzyme [Candidatus Bathyarchaeota archaeon]